MNARLSQRIAQTLRRLGPYLLVELLLPGGTLFALLLWLSQGNVRAGFSGVQLPVTTPYATLSMIDTSQSQAAAGAPKTGSAAVFSAQGVA